MDVEQDNAKQHSFVPDRTSTSAPASIALPQAALSRAPMQVDTPFNSHHTAEPNNSGEPAVLSHVILIISLIRQHSLHL